MPRKKQEETPKTNASTKSLLAELRSKGYPVKFASEIRQDPKQKSGIFAFDYVLDGGIAQTEGGHFIELSGAESSGKTTFTLKMIARFQELGKKCAFIDAEQSFDPMWAAVCGVDLDKLLVIQPDNLEQTGDLMVDLISNGFDFIVEDSIAALIPLEELEGSLQDKHMASQAKVNSPLVRKVLHASAGKILTIVFINQMREKVGGYGNPEVTPGGKALKHLFHSRIKFKISEYIEQGTKDQKEKIGFVCTLTNIKNKKGKPYRVSSIDFYLNGHLDNKKSLLYAGLKYGIIQQGGPWFSYKGQKFQGADGIIQGLDDKTWSEIENEIWSIVNAETKS